MVASLYELLSCLLRDECRHIKLNIKENLIKSIGQAHHEQLAWSVSIVLQNLIIKIVSRVLRHYTFNKLYYRFNPSMCFLKWQQDWLPNAEHQDTEYRRGHQDEENDPSDGEGGQLCNTNKLITTHAPQTMECRIFVGLCDTTQLWSARISLHTHLIL